MSEEIKLDWGRGPEWWDQQFNGMIGCRQISPACEHCYAKMMVERFKMNGDAGFEPTPHPKAKMPKKGIVFVGNLTDCFGEWVSYEEVIKWFSSMYTENKDFVPGRCNSVEQLIPNPASYVWITKRVGNMMNALKYAIADHPRAYYGFTAENQHWYNMRMRELFKYSGRKVVSVYDEERRCDRKYKCYRYELSYKHWVSCEPLLGPINLHLDEMVNTCDAVTTYDPIVPLIKSVVVGCESGPKRRPCKIEWVEDIVDQCRKANVPVFVKQLDLDGELVKDISKFPKHLQIRQLAWA